MANDPNQDVIQFPRSRRVGAPFLTDDIANAAMDTSPAVPNSISVSPDATVVVSPANGPASNAPPHHVRALAAAIAACRRGARGS